MKTRGIFAIAIAAAAIAPSIAYAQFDPTERFYPAFTAADGRQVWQAPSGLKTDPYNLNGPRPVYTPSAGGMLVEQTGNVRLASGSQVAINAKRFVTGAAIFTAAKTVIGGPAGLTLLLAPPIIQWINSENVRINTVSPSILQPFEKKTPGGTYGSGGPFESSTLPGYCSNWRGQFSWAERVVAADSGGTCGAYLDYRNGSGNLVTDSPFFNSPSYTAGPPGSGTWQRSSMDDISQYMSERPVIPSGVIPAILEAAPSLVIPTTPVSVTGPATAPSPPPVVKTETVTPPAPTVTTTTTPGNPQSLPSNTPTSTGSSTGSMPGPSSSGSPTSQPTTSNTTSTYNPTTNQTTNTTTTTNSPVTNTTTTTTTTNITYNTTTATATTKSTTTVESKSTATQEVISSATSEKTEKPKEEDQSSLVDTALPDLPELYKPKYPEGIKGVWNDNIAAIKALPLFTLGNQLMPSFATSGACPVINIPLGLATWAAYGTRDVSPPCWVWDFGKLIIVCSALLLARRLVFGG